MLAELQRWLHGGRRLQTKIDRAAVHRAKTSEDLRWCHRGGETLERIVREVEAVVANGELVLSGGADPRDQRRARKRKGELF